MDKILIIDFGSQYTQLIAKRLRQVNKYCEIQPYQSFVIDSSVKGVILSGSPSSVNEVNSPDVDIDSINVPILGICYGAQFMNLQELNKFQNLFRKVFINPSIKVNESDEFLLIDNDG